MSEAESIEPTSWEAEAAPEPDPATITALNAMRQLEESQREAAALRSAHEELTLQLQTAHADHLAAIRRALLAEHAGQVVPELVQGGTTEELEASVGAAGHAFDRIAGQLRDQAAAMVPIGASASAAPSPDVLTPMQKITHALTRNGKG